MSKNHQTLLWRLSNLVDQHRTRGLIAIVVAITIAVTASKVFPRIDALMKDVNVVAFITFLIVVDIALALNKKKPLDQVQFCENQDDSFQEMIPASKGCKKAFLIEYAGATTLPLIRALHRERAQVRILIQNPGLMEGLHRERSIATLDTLYNSIFTATTDDFEIRCYALQYTLRGRYLQGKILELGWLTPDYKNKMAYGHTNPSLLVRVFDPSTEHFLSFFNRTFDDYWNHPGTVDGKLVLEKLKPPRLKAPANGKKTQMRS